MVMRWCPECDAEKTPIPRSIDPCDTEAYELSIDDVFRDGKDGDYYVTIRASVQLTLECPVCQHELLQGSVSGDEMLCVDTEDWNEDWDDAEELPVECDCIKVRPCL